MEDLLNSSNKQIKRIKATTTTLSKFTVLAVSKNIAHAGYRGITAELSHLTLAVSLAFCILRSFLFTIQPTARGLYS